MLKKILLIIVAGFILIQFIRPKRNLSNDMTYDISAKYTIPGNVSEILKNACYDCHSNQTKYPWYSYVQPVAWWLNDHITNGKRRLNFSAFTKLPVANQNRKLEQTADQIDKKEMPIESYTYLGLHKAAKLTDEQKRAVIEWARAQMDILKATYPADSLVMKRRPGAPRRN